MILAGGTAVRLDGADKASLELAGRTLLEHALTVRDLAGRIHLSATPTHERIKYLEQQGVIRQYAALLNHRLLARPSLLSATFR